MKALVLLILSVMLDRGSEHAPNLLFIFADDPGITDIGACTRHFNKVAADDFFHATLHLDVSVKHPDHGRPLSPHSAICERPQTHLGLAWQTRTLRHSRRPQEKDDLSNEKSELTAILHQQVKHWLKDNVAPRYWPQRDETVSPKAANGPFPYRDLR